MIARLFTVAMGAVAAPVLASLCPAAGEDVAAMEAAVREGRPADALKVHVAGEDEGAAVEAAYWRGQALARLGRPEEAAVEFYKVPAGHRLYPYAARGLLYCAWESPSIDFAEVSAPLTESADEEVAALALAALAEYRLRYTESDDTAAFARLEKLAATRPDLAPLVKLLTLHTYRQSGDFEGGLNYARTLEHEAELTPLMRQRVRLEISELYYAKEKAVPPAPAEGAEESDEGKGEETLMQFISANPDSPLLEEAFRRLHCHGAVNGSEYARSKLAEWAADAAHPHRAALAQLSRLQESPAAADSSAIANRAASELPGEPCTLGILHEQVRRLQEQGKDEQAALYLSLLETLEREPTSADTLFARARQRWQSPATAAQLFLKSAETASGPLLAPALVNGLICAELAGDTATAERLLSEHEFRRTRRELLLAHAGLVADTDPQLALRELEELETLEPTPEQRADVLLDRTYIILKENPLTALQTLLALDEAQLRDWSDEQALRYAALLERAADLVHPEHPDMPTAEELLNALYSGCTALPRKEALALHMADRYSQSGKHLQAYDLLQELKTLQPTGEQRAATLYYAAQEAAKMSTLDALVNAEAVYAECARQGSRLTSMAIISQAAILVRINRTTEAFDLLYNLMQQATLSTEEMANLLTVQADAYGMDRTAQSTKAALDAISKLLELPQLPRAWRLRALLQRASIYARAQMHAEALRDYREVMHEEQTPAEPVDDSSGFIYYYAGAGAVYRLIQMGEYSEAGNLADKIADWPGENKKPGPKSEAFRSWAQQIHQRSARQKDN